MKKKRPKILMFVPQFPMPVVGGLEKQAFILTQALIKKGIKVQVLSGKINNSNISKKFDKNLNVTRIYWPKNIFLRFIFSSFSMIVYFIKNKNNFDIIHLHQTSSNSFLLIILSKVFNKKIILKLVNIDDYGIPGLAKSTFGFLKIFILKKVDCIISMSKISSNELKKIYYNSKKIFYVSNGVILKNQKKTQSSRKIIKVLSLGRLSIEKRNFDMLKSWSVITKKNKNVYLDICGDGPLFNQLVAYAKKLKISESVKFHGNIENVEHFMRDASIFVNTSEAEGNSNSILEAMTFSLPCIATGVGGTPMLVGQEGEKLICQVGNIKEISQKITFLIKNPLIRKKIGSGMRKRVIQNFKIEKIADQYICMYDKIFKRSKQSLLNCSNKKILNYLLSENT